MTNTHPATLYHNRRRLIFGIYEKHGFDRAVEYIKKSNLLPTMKAGLNGEIIFYERKKEEFKLEPLLDVGVKADFAGIRNKKMVNFDVTTNSSYKDIDDYAEVIQKRKKVYEIVLVNPKTEELVFFPLKFPICPKCGKFSHYILYLEPPSTEFYRIGDISDTQTIIRFCPKCKDFEEKNSQRFQVYSLLSEIEEMAHEMDVDETSRYSSAEIEQHRIRESISTVQFFEGTTDLLISGLAENDYVITDHEGGGYYDGLMHWSHPLAKLGKYLGIYYGKWEPDRKVVETLYQDFRCMLCGLKGVKSFYYNHKKRTMQCRRCGAIHDISESLHYEGYEIKRAERRKFR